MEDCIFIIDNSEYSVEILKSYLKELGYDNPVKVFLDCTSALTEIKNSGQNAIVFADLSENQETDAILKEFNKYTNKIIIMSSNYSADIIVRAMRIGAKEFLPKPVLKTDLEKALKTSFTEKNNINNSKVISVFSNKGGIGKTTIAINLAYELTKNTGNKTVIIDLNRNMGDISTFLDISPILSLSQIISEILPHKDKSITECLTKYKDSELYILSDTSNMENCLNISVPTLENLFNRLKEEFTYIIVDLPSNLDTILLKTLDISDLILFTTIVNIPAIRNCQRCLNLFESRNYSTDKYKIVLNRYIENDEIKVKDIENAINNKIYWKIPNNYFSIMESINRGLTVSEINPDSNISCSFRDLSLQLADDIIRKNVEEYKI